MQMRSKLLVLASLILTSANAAFAASFSFNQLVVFGDSLSDNGNAAFALGGTLPGNYAPNAFTDGPNTSPKTTGPFGLWIDQFSALAAVPDPQPFLANQFVNTNYAVASAQTGSANPQDISNQVAAFTAAHPGGAPGNALYTIWGGANDLYNGTSSGAVAADNLYGNIQFLYSQGARQFLWLNLPQLGNTPRGSGTAAALNAQSTAFDQRWAIDLASLKLAGVNIVGVDINAEFNAIQANYTSFGFTNISSPAQGTSGNPNSYLFWDTEHPTTAADALIAQTAFAAESVPEPGSLSMLLSGIGLVYCRMQSNRRIKRI